MQSGRLDGTSCVIADVQMPGMNGLELLAMMRAQGHGVPFIFITAFPDETTPPEPCRRERFASCPSPSRDRL